MPSTQQLQPQQHTPAAALSPASLTCQYLSALGKRARSGSCSPAKERSRQQQRSLPPLFPTVVAAAAAASADSIAPLHRPHCAGGLTPRWLRSNGSSTVDWQWHATPLTGSQLPPDVSCPVSLRAARLIPREERLAGLDLMPHSAVTSPCVTPSAQDADPSASVASSDETQYDAQQHNSTRFGAAGDEDL